MGVVNEPWYLKNLFFSRGSKSIGLMGLILVLAPSVFTFFKAAKQMKNKVLVYDSSLKVITFSSDQTQIKRLQILNFFQKIRFVCFDLLKNSFT